jgi:hypothetical protein
MNNIKCLYAFFLHQQASRTLLMNTTTDTRAVALISFSNWCECEIN